MLSSTVLFIISINFILQCNFSYSIKCSNDCSLETASLDNPISFKNCTVTENKANNSMCIVYFKMYLISKNLEANLTSTITDDIPSAELSAHTHLDLGDSNSSYIEVTYRCNSNNLCEQEFAREAFTNLRRDLEIDKLTEKLASLLYNPTEATVPDIMYCSDGMGRQCEKPSYCQASYVYTSSFDVAVIHHRLPCVDNTSASNLDWEEIYKPPQNMKQILAYRCNNPECTIGNTIEQVVATLRKDYVLPINISMYKQPQPTTTPSSNGIMISYHSLYLLISLVFFLYS